MATIVDLPGAQLVKATSGRTPLPFLENLNKCPDFGICLDFFFIVMIWAFFHDHSRITGLGKSWSRGRGKSLITKLRALKIMP